MDEPQKLEMDKSEKEMLALEQQYAELKLKLKLAKMKKKILKTTTREKKTSEEILAPCYKCTLVREFLKIPSQIGESGQTDKLTFCLPGASNRLGP